MIPVIIFILLVSTGITAEGAILINELSAGGSIDWIEIKATEDSDEADISQLYVTMYYGTNERIALSPVTVRGRDIPETPWDDRFAVIHFSSGGEADETDAAGDINGNGVRDLYCNNYGLWNTDCVTAIDTDDEPQNGGIIDFVAYSNRDGTPNSTITGYMNAASDHGEWAVCSYSNPQECMSFIGENGMNSYSTLSRRSSDDTNSMNDFLITPYATPGRDNLTDVNAGRKKIAKPLSGKIFHRPEKSEGIISLRIFIYRECSLRIRIFNSAGTTVYSSELFRKLTPGYFTAKIRESDLRGETLTGLYPVTIESYAGGRTDKSGLFLVIIRR